MPSFLLPSSLILLLLLLLTPTTSANPAEDDYSSGINTYIVRVQNDMKPSAFPVVDQWYASTLQSLSSSQLHSPAASPKFLHVYRSAFHGFSARLSPSQATQLGAHPSVLAVLPDRTHPLHTTRSPQFLRLLSPTSRPNSLLSLSNSASQSIIAFLDSGINPDHRSFRDTQMGPIPPRWNGTCEAGPNFPSASCNRKLIGARFFSSGASATGNSTSDVLSPVDTHGHGTHTASTAAGRPAAGASLLGYAAGVASGAAPKARIAVYKVCWSSGCFDSDILAAVDRAVDDGVDVISLSVGAGPVPYHIDPIAIAAFAAAERGVVVSASAGNGGPSEMTVTNVAPWITTVGAGTIDRRFPVDVILGDGSALTGAGIYSGPGSDKYFPLIYSGNAATSRPGFRSSAPFCLRESLDPAAVQGKIVLCERGAVPRAEKALAVKEAGGVGMIVANQPVDGEGVVPDAHVIPSVSIGFSAANSIHTYIRNESNPRVRLIFRGTQLNVRPAPTVAAFSGRGPNGESPHVIKPDIIAPGVGILAGWVDGVGPTDLESDTRRTEFNILSGTSMACPHVSGVAALLKAEHPDWSPAAIRSAMMTTAYVADDTGEEMVDESSGNKSTVWAIGSGHVDPEKAVDPGLVYDLTADDYVDFLCSSNYSTKDIEAITRRAAKCWTKGLMMPWDLNYPSISVVLDQSTAGRLEAVVHRTVTSVAEGPAEYVGRVGNPAGVSVVVEPAKLVFKGKGERLEFVVRVSAERVVGLPAGNSRAEFGELTWRDGKHVVRSPIAVTWQQPY